MLSARLRGSIAALSASLMLFACQPADGVVTDSNANGSGNSQQAKASPAQVPDEDGFIPSGSGTEKETPAAGTGNVQGKVLYNEKPAAGIEVKLCQKFSQFVGGCSGETFTTKTDEQGEYLIKGVPPGDYEAITAKVFDTNYYVFATSGFVSSAKYRIEDGKTYFAPDSNLFKGDLKVTAPKAGSKIAADNIEVKWDAYPDAAYYKVSLHGEASTTTDYDHIGKRVDGTSYALGKPLAAGEYRVRVEAFNANDVKLAEAPSDMKFGVTGNAGKQ